MFSLALCQAGEPQQVAVERTQDFQCAGVLSTGQHVGAEQHPVDEPLAQGLHLLWSIVLREPGERLQ